MPRPGKNHRHVPLITSRNRILITFGPTRLNNGGNPDIDQNLRTIAEREESVGGRDGAIERVLELPVSQVTSCVFGGDRFETLYITSASIGLDEAALAAQPLAGGLFEVDVGIKGLPTLRFAG